MFARDGSGGAGSEARGEGRERGYLFRTTVKPPVAQRAGGIYIEREIRGKRERERERERERADS